jgi:6-phosphogluconolactonase
MFLQDLSARDLDWTKVTITLVDERFVAANNPRSNHLLVAENLLRNKAKAANFLPLYQAAGSVEEAARLATSATATIGNPFDVAILGMGGDGHTASFFPDGSNLKVALDPNTPRGIITMEAEGAGEPRLTFTFSSLQDARLLVLHIEGESKKDVLTKAQSAGDEAEMPIRAILRRAASPVEIYWAP